MNANIDRSEPDYILVPKTLSPQHSSQLVNKSKRMRITEEQAKLEVDKVVHDLHARWMNLNEDATAFLDGWQEDQDWKSI